MTMTYNVKVLGNIYTIEKLETRNDFMAQHRLDGYCDRTTRNIKVCIEGSHYQNKKEYLDEVVRHELLHAFLLEGGIAYNTSVHTEQYIDWLVVQWDKISDMFDREGSNRIEPDKRQY